MQKKDLVRQALEREKNEVARAQQTQKELLATRSGLAELDEKLQLRIRELSSKVQANAERLAQRQREKELRTSRNLPMIAILKERLAMEIFPMRRKRAMLMTLLRARERHAVCFLEH